ncbi:hypothetical protein [Microbulbifer sp. ZKSA002]|uniref:hypothetical protein n=1 Tax=Microbulbifer sp. ZKSA002 TaxID=3243388 RepID=UPI004039A537
MELVNFSGYFRVVEMLKDRVKRLFSYTRSFYYAAQARFSKNIPEWAAVDLMSVSKEIDISVSGNGKCASSILYIDLPLYDKEVGRNYFFLKSSLKKKSYTYIFISPSLELAIDLSSKCCRGEVQGVESGDTLFLVMEKEQSPHLVSSCSSIDVINIGSLHLGLVDLGCLIERLLIQLKPEKIFIVSSLLCWRLLEHRIRTLNNFSEVAVYFPGEGNLCEELPDSHLERFIIESMPFLGDLIFSDRKIMEYWQGRLGFFGGMFLSGK